MESDSEVVADEFGEQMVGRPLGLLDAVCRW